MDRQGKNDRNFHIVGPPDPEVLGDTAFSHIFGQHCPTRPRPEGCFIVGDLRSLGYANNHYAGHGPGTVKLFLGLVREEMNCHQPSSTC